MERFGCIAQDSLRLARAGITRRLTVGPCDTGYSLRQWTAAVRESENTRVSSLSRTWQVTLIRLMIVSCTSSFSVFLQNHIL